MDTKPLGASGERAPEVGFGTWKFNGDAALLRRAIELGAFLIDTAESYGTESAVGRAIAGIRDKAFIATKVSPSHFRREQLLQACDRSLTRLGVDTIDLYQLHAPNPRVPIEETMGAMGELAAAGKVRHIGVSNFSVKELRRRRPRLDRTVSSRTRSSTAC